MTDENAELVVKEGMKQVFAPFADLISRLLGEAASEIGLGLRDSVKVWRLKRQVRLLQEVERLVQQSGKDIKPVPPRLFFPIFDAASVEGDDEMQSRWAALLANQATSGSVHPSYIEMLKQMSSQDARLLDKIYDWCESRHTRVIEWWILSPRNEQYQKDEESLANLTRLGLVDQNYNLIDGNKQLKIVAGNSQIFSSTPQLKQDFFFTGVAVKFVEACRAPKPSHI
jgi:Abortive infection alpha